MGFFYDQSEKDREDYERGQKDGSSAGALDQFAHNFESNSEAYEKGWANGIDNQPEDKVEFSPSQSDSRSDDDEFGPISRAGSYFFGDTGESGETYGGVKADNDDDDEEEWHDLPDEQVRVTPRGPERRKSVSVAQAPASYSGGGYGGSSSSYPSTDAFMVYFFGAWLLIWVPILLLVLFVICVRACAADKPTPTVSTSESWFEAAKRYLGRPSYGSSPTTNSPSSADPVLPQAAAANAEPKSEVPSDSVAAANGPEQTVEPVATGLFCAVTRTRISDALIRVEGVSSTPDSSVLDFIFISNRKIGAYVFPIITGDDQHPAWIEDDLRNVYQVVGDSNNYEASDYGERVHVVRGIYRYHVTIKPAIAREASKLSIVHVDFNLTVFLKVAK
ncbi:MAG: hypothetical protein ACM3KM_00270 [Acidobacteriaceae bacterium]